MSAFPFVSVIMPVFSEERFVERSLGTVLAQDYPADRFEVIVVDGMSTDRTREIIRAMQAKHPRLALWPGIAWALINMQIGYGMGFLAGLARCLFGRLPMDRLFERVTR